MVRELIQLPIQIGAAVAGAVAGAVRGRLGGAVQPPIAWEPPPAAPEPVRPDPEAMDWDPDAPVQPGGSSPDDLVIADRVKTQLFGAVDAPTGEINLNVENGVVFLRGHLEDPEQIEELVVLAAAVEGVLGVEDLIGR